VKFSLSRWLPVLLWAGFIFIASARSNPYQALPASTLGSSGRDELLGRFLHAGEYAVLAALTARALVWRSKPRFSLLVAALGLTALYALSDEAHQLFVPGRSFELRDLALDITGAAVGLAGYTLIRLFWQIRAGKAPHV
jgi:VanZ family protein